ncbi:MAG: hypothetical protein ACPG6Z_03690, partial [Nitrosopumilus sp.]
SVPSGFVIIVHVLHPSYHTEQLLGSITGKADFGLSNMLKLAMSHPKLAVRQLFNLVKSKQ